MITKGSDWLLITVIYKALSTYFESSPLCFIRYIHFQFSFIQREKIRVFRIHPNHNPLKCYCLSVRLVAKDKYIHTFSTGLKSQSPMLLLGFIVRS